MKTLSVTQEYTLCALKENGKIPLLKSTEVTVCLVMGGLLELLEQHVVHWDEKGRLILGEALPESLGYLRPLYEQITDRKPMTARALAEKFVFSATDKNLHQLLGALGESLEAAGYGTLEREKGLLHEKVTFLPEPQAVQRVVDKIRAEFLEDGALSEDVVVLTALLQESGLLKQYFSKYETDTLKVRLQEVKQNEAYAIVAKMIDDIELMMAVVATAGANW